MNTAKIYYDINGNPCSIHQIVKREPDWAANRIQEGERAIAERDALRAENESLKQNYLRAVDEALVCAHLGTAEPTDSYETAKGKLNQLICYEASVREYFEVEALKAKLPRWIPVTERLPERNVITIAADKDGNRRLLRCYPDDKTWWDSSRPVDKITHWMPLLDAPEQEPK